MSTIHIRFAPDYLFFGLLQPVFDGMKLLSSYATSLYASLEFYYMIVTMFSLAIVLLLFISFTSDLFWYTNVREYDLLFVLCLLLMLGISLLLVCVICSSRFSFIAGIRYLYLVVCFELVFGVVVLGLIFISTSFNISFIISCIQFAIV